MGIMVTPVLEVCEDHHCSQSLLLAGSELIWTQNILLSSSANSSTIHFYLICSKFGAAVMVMEIKRKMERVQDASIFFPGIR